jgi:Mn-dependent DtxR family transcriptional regulator
MDETLVRVMLDSRLTPTSKALYGLLRSKPTMSRKDVAAALNRNPRHIGSLERQLVGLGYLEIVQRQVKGRQIRLYEFPGAADAVGADRLAS